MIVGSRVKGQVPVAQIGTGARHFEHVLPASGLRRDVIDGTCFRGLAGPHHLAGYGVNPLHVVALRRAIARYQSRIVVRAVGVVPVLGGEQEQGGSMESRSFSFVTGGAAS